MAAKLGYGGLGNTNGARSFAGKEEAVPALQTGSRMLRRRYRTFRIILYFVGF